MNADSNHIIRRVLRDALSTHAVFGTPGAHDAYEYERVAYASAWLKDADAIRSIVQIALRYAWDEAISQHDAEAVLNWFDDLLGEVKAQDE